MAGNYVPIPKDMAKVKTKVALGFTKRQLIGLGLGALFGLPVMYTLYRTAGIQPGLIALFCIATPFVFCSMYMRDGIPAEEWLKMWIKHEQLSQKVRRYGKPDKSKKADAAKKESKTAKTDAKTESYFALSYEKKETLVTVLGEAFKSIYMKLAKKPQKTVTTQDTLMFQDIYKNGLCYIGGEWYSRTIMFGDINYRLAHKEEKNQIFTEWCSLLNSFGESVNVQITFVNEAGEKKIREKTIRFDRAGDKFDEIREEYEEMLMTQIEKGSHGLTKKKYMTFAIKAKTRKEANRRLYRIEADALAQLRSMGVKSESMTGVERLRALSNIINEKERNILIDREEMRKLGKSSKDLIAPRLIDLTDKRNMKIGSKWYRTSHFMLEASELSDEALAEFLDMETEQVITIHIEPVEHQKSIKMMKSKVSDIDKMKIEEQKKAIRQGYDMDVLPPDLSVFSEESKKILDELQTQNEKYYMITILVTNIARDINRLENDATQSRSIALRHNCDLKPYDYNQEYCLSSILPLGVNKTYMRRGVTTSALAVLIPFTTQELFMEGKSLYYGVNALSNNIIMANRKELTNPNGLVLGIPGSGKSFAAKREITNNKLITQDNIIICDPEGEYSPLVDMLEGEVIDISPISNHVVNPLDINMNYSEDDSPIVLKTDFIISMMELICGGREGLSPIERSVIDRCVRNIYRAYMDDPKPENVPIMGDLYDTLLKQDGPEAHNLANALELYVHGSMKIFNSRTNVNTDNRLVCYNIKKLGKNLRKIGMLIIQDQVWNTVTLNRASGRSTWYYIDEFHLLLKEEQTAQYSVEIWKRFRKWGGIPTGITQNVKDLLGSAEIENIFENSEFVYLLSQSAADRAILQEKLNLSAGQVGYVDNAEQGCGLIKFGRLILPFEDKFPKDTKLYKVMTTKLEEVVSVSAGKA